MYVGPRDDLTLTNFLFLKSDKNVLYDLVVYSIILLANKLIYDKYLYKIINLIK